MATNVREIADGIYRRALLGRRSTGEDTMAGGRLKRVPRFLEKPPG